MKYSYKGGPQLFSCEAYQLADMKEKIRAILQLNLAQILKFNFGFHFEWPCFLAPLFLVTLSSPLPLQIMVAPEFF